MVHLTEIDATPGDGPLETAIQTRLGDIDSEQYRRNNAHVLRGFATFLRRDQDITRVDEVTASALRSYARALRQSVGDGDNELSASSAEQYWSLVSAFLSWAVREGLLEKNPATLKEAQEPLPESDETASRQFWSKRDRKAICATADQLVDDLLDSEPSERARIACFRDRALVYTLAFTGCRGAEIAAVSGDDKRNGLRWEDVELNKGLCRVYGKTRTTTETPIFEPAIDPLRRLQRELDPEPDWPVFPSSHLPSLYAQLPDSASPDADQIWDQLRMSNSTPPAISTEGVRRVLRQMCDESDYGFEEPLKPHGARRGLGDTLYQEQAELAQEVLRHKDITTTHESYEQRRVEKLKEQGDSLFQ